MADHAHDHQACMTAALERAESVCAERGLRLTPLRREVLELVWNGHEPVGAYDLLESLSQRGRRASPPTVYRTLEFLMEAGLVHRLDSLNAFVGCDDPGSGHHSAFLICRRCRTVAELAGEVIEREIAALAGSAGFVAEQHVLEVQGLCAHCQREDKQSAPES